ncbi:DNA ligase 1 isoform X2 [Agrilus planipennis]|uniref:DNA ligase n=1 Tax=Agrilus planipennis TaxID=224129 RepID=A0A1W4WY29_AGRPL|nr:DNA ligase 1 isoform X2 [Agrilus planipennis]
MFQPAITSFFTRKSADNENKKDSGKENETEKETSKSVKSKKTNIEGNEAATSRSDGTNVEDKLKTVGSKRKRIAVIDSESSEEESGTVEKLNKKNNNINGTNSETSEKSKPNTDEKENEIDETVNSNKDGNTSKKQKTEVFMMGLNKNEKDAESKTEKDGISYNPSKSKYHPINDATWKYGEKVPYLALARTLEEIENISARLKIIEILSNFFRSIIVLSPEDLLPSLYLCLNRIAPAYENLELGIAETSLIKAIAQSTGRTVAQIKADAQKVGDLGLVAEQSKTNQRMLHQPAPLTIRQVFANLKEIAKMTGQTSQGKKIDKIKSMFISCKHSEARFLIRSLAGKLRIGLAEQSVLQALALACATTPPHQSYPPERLDLSNKSNFKEKYDELALILKTTYCECPNYEKIIPVILQEGIEKLPEKCKLTPSVPLKPMLAFPTKGVHEVLKRFEGLKFTCEWKYDGERAQVHLSDNGDVFIYSRNQENNTTKYPDIVSRLETIKGENVKSFILDCEVVAWDTANKTILPFQILSTRKRKDAVEENIKVQVCLFMFDLLYFNGAPLVREPFIKRRTILRDNFKEVEGQFHFAKNLDTTVIEEIQDFLEESVKGKCEGLMIKTVEEEATYEIAKRSHNWLKLKKDYLEGVGDTLDVVVIGGYLGKGKRTGTYGGFLLACYDKENEEYQSICKIGTGFSDEVLQTHTEFLKKHIIEKPKQYYRFDPNIEPDHWFDVVQVWEVKCADLSLSPVHRAAIGIVDPERGISLRFPRFIRIRDDKTVEEATSADQVAEMYNNQDQIKNQTESTATADEDFY